MKNRSDGFRSRRPDSRSLTFICLVQFLRMVLIAAAIYLGTIYLYDRKLADAFPTMDDVLNWEEGILHDDWERFGNRYQDTRMIVFDNRGDLVFASDEEIRSSISADDLRYISYESGYITFNDFPYRMEDGSLKHLILAMHSEGDEEHVDQYCILDESGRNLEGNLFSEEEQLGSHAMELLQGRFPGDYQISRTTYLNTQGEVRDLVFVFPQLTVEQYGRYVDSMDRFRRAAVLLILLELVLGVIFLQRTISRNTELTIDTIRRCMSEEENDGPLPEIVTEFRMIAEEIRGVSAELKGTQKARKGEEMERRRVIASLSHDLKTPIAVIMGYTQAFRDNQIPEDQREHYYKMLCEKSKLASDMVDSMSEYTKMEHPEFRLHLESTEVGEFLRQYLMSIYDELTEAKIDLYPQIPEEPLTVKIDRRMIIRVLNNLIDNTRKYNPDGVRLLVDVHREGNAIVIRVEDDGIGIPLELRDAVFHPFVTSNEARTSGKGTGLGLAIAERILQSHGGSLHLVDAVDEGYTTEFRMVLPVE